MSEGAEVRPFTPAAGDRLLLATDGLTNHVSEEDLSAAARHFPDPQVWAEHLVELALKRGCARQRHLRRGGLRGSVVRLPGHLPAGPLGTGREMPSTPQRKPERLFASPFLAEYDTY